MKSLNRSFRTCPGSSPRTSLSFKADDLPDTTAHDRAEAGRPADRTDRRAPTAAETVLFFLQSAELDMLRVAMASIPSPLWESDENGHVIWANAAYREPWRADRRRKTPDAHLFDILMPVGNDPVPRARSRQELGRTRIPSGTKSPPARSNGTWLHHAVDIDAVVKAETAQRNFVQTLTKTFAHLPIGLAVFDRNRQLALFNPALIDLTSLPADFLSGRPNLLSFFDHMRENRMMPEPKNYSGWREQMAELVAAASRRPLFRNMVAALRADLQDHRAPASRRRHRLPDRRYQRRNLADPPVSRRNGAEPVGPGCD